MRYVTLKSLDGAQEFRVSYPVKSMAAYEDRFGGTSLIAEFIKFQEAAAQSPAQILAMFKIKTVINMMLAGLWADKPDATADDAAEVIDACGFQPSFEAIVAALTKSFGVAEGNAPAPGVAAPAETAQEDIGSMS